MARITVDHTLKEGVETHLDRVFHIHCFSSVSVGFSIVIVYTPVMSLFFGAFLAAGSSAGTSAAGSSTGTSAAGSSTGSSVT